MYLILLGAPGAGKGTQSAITAQRLKLAHVASGDLFRQALAQGMELGKQAKSYMEQGKLVPDEITIRMVLERLAAPDAASGAILDGFPRNLEQAKALDRALAERGKMIDKAIYIQVSEPELIKRLSGRWVCRNCQTPYHATNAPPKVWGRCNRCGGELYQRADDTEETVKKRLRVYATETAPLMAYYRKAGKLQEIEGEGTEGEVAQKIVDSLEKDSIQRSGHRYK